ncbi:MAG: hypothetical protein WCC66_11010 [Rhizobiaceae bacterium]
MNGEALPASGPTPLETYKNMLQRVIDSRPSGTRQRLAEALGKNRSFISQITNPAYVTPVPVQHLEIIFHICHFSPADKRDFLAAYRTAHPGRLDTAEGSRPTRSLTIDLPDFGNAQMNRRVDEMVHSMVRAIQELFLASADGQSENAKEDRR